MFVASEHAGRGIGAALLAHLVADVGRDPDILQLILTVTDTNRSARALYERAGFRSFGVEPRAIRVGDAFFDKNHMILLLEPR